MDGFEKIDLTKQPAAPLPQTQKLSMSRRASQKNKKRVWIGIAIVLLLFVVFGIIFPTINLVKQVKVTYAQAKLVSGAAKNQNVEDASTQLAKTKDELLKT